MRRLASRNQAALGPSQAQSGPRGSFTVRRVLSAPCVNDRAHRKFLASPLGDYNTLSHGVKIEAKFATTMESSALSFKTVEEVRMRGNRKTK